MNCYPATQCDIQELISKVDQLEKVLQNQFYQKVNKTEEEWISEVEARKILGVGRTTMAKMRAEGLIPFSQYRKKIRFRKQDVLDFLNKNYSK